MAAEGEAPVGQDASQLRASQAGTGQLRASQMDASQLRASQAGTSQLRASQLRASSFAAGLPKADRPPAYPLPDPSAYVVLDLETNGLDEERDDLLSISVYKPDDGRIYDRFLPLERQVAVDPVASQINGIRTEDLAGLAPLGQAEADRLVRDFELDRRLVLTYGGGGFDERFLRRYLRDHGLRGFEKVRFHDFKKRVFSSGQSVYPASKDNLCRALGIAGVEKVHSSANDCRLEWELFRRMAGQGLLVAEGEVYRLRQGRDANPGFVYPALWLDTFARLERFSGLPRHHVRSQVVLETALSPEATCRTLCLRELRNDVCGAAVRGALGELLGARGADAGVGTDANPESPLPRVGTELWLGAGRGEDLLAAGLAHLEHLGSFVQTGGSFRDGMAPDEKGAPLTRLAGRHLDALASLREELGPLAGILHDALGDAPRANELVVDDEWGVCARRDFSGEGCVLFVKVGSPGLKPSRAASQLFYGSQGRKALLLGIVWGEAAASVGADAGGAAACARPTRLVLRRIVPRD